MLREAGYRQRTDSRELVLLDADNDTEFFFLRPRDIAVYVGSGRLDVGITGEDLLLDSGAQAEAILPLGFAGSTFRFAGRPGVADEPGRPRRPPDRHRLPRRAWRATCASSGIDAEVIRLDGAVETAVRLDVADAIADVVSNRHHAAQRRPGDLRRAAATSPGGADPAAAAPSSRRGSSSWCAGCRA